ncbi:MAG TPA: hypothetical protein VJ739_03595 [Gemmataceae bacterium]|nr:hypothetical protein [Gemmataceae bacterium]
MSHSGVELTAEGFEAFYQAIRPLCYRVERKGGVILRPADAALVGLIQRGTFDHLPAFEQAVGFVWMTGAAGRGLREALRPVAADDEAATFALRLLEWANLETDDDVFCVELQPE